MNDLSVGELADRAQRRGGPYQPDALVAAASLVAELVRRLNRATAHAPVLPRPSDLHTVVGALAGAVAGLEQLLGQLAGRAEQWSSDPRRLRHDQHRHVLESMDFALLDLHAAADLRRAAAMAPVMAEALTAAHARTGQVSLVDADGVR